MSKSRFTEKRKLSILCKYSASANILELPRKHGVSPTALYKWRSLTMVGVSELRRMRSSESENTSLKSLSVDALLEPPVLGPYREEFLRCFRALLSVGLPLGYAAFGYGVLGGVFGLFEADRRSTCVVGGFGRC